MDGESRRWPSRRRLRASRLLVVGDVVAGRFRRRFPEIWRKSRTFAVVRNPYDRLISAWKYCASTRDLPLLDALTHALPKKRWWRRYDHDYVHFTMRQSDFLVEEGRPIVGTLIRFARLPEELRGFFARSGVQLPPLRHRNKGARPVRSLAKLRPATLMAANRHLAPDFEHFGYRPVEPGPDAAIADPTP